MTYKIYQVDAFTDVLFSGNPAAVVPLENWMLDDLMQKIANENNLAETAFFVKEEDCYYIRWFTPLAEVALCGHATVATAHVMKEHLGISENVISFDCKSGNLTVRKEDDLYVLNFPSDTVSSSGVPGELLSTLSILPTNILKGKTDYLLVYENEEQIRSLIVNFHLLSQVKARGIIVTAPGNEYDFVSRFFAPSVGINEDPVTGSAHTTLIPYWSKRLGKEKMMAKQISQRGGIIHCTYLGNRVEMGGKAITYLEGKIKWR